jgi:hypothetical protein
VSASLALARPRADLTIAFVANHSPGTSGGRDPLVADALVSCVLVMKAITRSARYRWTSCAPMPTSESTP